MYTVWIVFIQVFFCLSRSLSLGENYSSTMQQQQQTVSAVAAEEELEFRDEKNLNPFTDNQLKLAYGSMLNQTCRSSDDCLLKNSICNPLNKRCECDFSTLPDNSRCQVIYCGSNDECATRFTSTICLFGRCQCRYGIKANGQCVDVKMDNVKQLPDWAITLIAFSALFSGIFGGRSQVVAQLIQHIVAIIMLLSGTMSRFATRSISLRNMAQAAQPAQDATTATTTTSATPQQQPTTTTTTTLDSGKLLETLLHSAVQASLETDPSSGQQIITLKTDTETPSSIPSKNE